MSIFYRNFLRLCKAKGITPNALMLQLNWPPNRVTRWKHGSHPKMSTMEELAKALGCEIKDFFDDNHYVPEAVESDPAINDEEYILNIYRQLSLKDKHRFIVLVDSFVPEFPND